MYWKQLIRYLKRVFEKPQCDSTAKESKTVNIIFAQQKIGPT